MPATELRCSVGATQKTVQTRVVVGGALCGVAALGLWWAFEQSAAEPETHYAIARTLLVPGVIVEAADIALVPIRLPAEVAATVFDRHDAVVGTLVASHVHPGELLAHSDVTSPGDAQGIQAGYAVAVELDRPRALNGLVGPGDRVDVVATGHTEASGATVVARDAGVLDVDDRSEERHPAATVTVTLQVPDLAVATALAAAADADAITLIRTWGLP
ncbi:RcpC/CpaB family pilus assembly protein [Candidatus Poriferisodalis sp.]|uniref:RcpC/CpaB family pilus assembly protein n=1 Tax=Candidatus Poriferisodalis sp. TaxID=3101277 RepID=UPI003B014F52